MQALHTCDLVVCSPQRYSALRFSRNLDISPDSRASNYHGAVLSPLASGFAPHKGVAKHLKPARIRLTLCSAECVDRRTDANIYETALLNQLLPGCTRQTTGNSSCP